MDRNVVVGIVVVLALLVVGWWYWAFMAPAAMAPTMTEETTEGQIVTDDTGAPVLVGSWKSKQDARFIRVFNADNTVVDRYEGDESATMTGSWSFVTDLQAEQPELPEIGGARYVKVQFPEEVMYFAITNLTATDLSMIYLSGNGSLEFTRMQ